MAKFNITADSVKLLGDKKTAMEVTFIADDGREVTNYHEVESVDETVVQEELQKAADEFEARGGVAEAKTPILEEGKDLQIELTE